MAAPATEATRSWPEASPARREYDHRPEQVRLLFAQSPAPLLASVFLAAFTAGVLARPGSALPLLGWWLALTVVTALRLRLIAVYKRQAPEDQNQDRWQNAYLVGAFAAGVAWGALALFLDFAWPLPYQLLIYAMLVGVATAGISNNGALGTAYAAFLVPCLLPLAVRSLMAPETVLVTMGVMLLILGVVLLSVAGSFERALLRSFALASDQARLLDRVSRAHQALEAEAGDRKRAEAALLREKERAQVTLHSIGDGVITTDNAGCIDYMNPSAERLTGWTIEEAKGQPLAAVYPLHDEATREPIGGLQDTARRIESTLQAREPQLLRRRDGEEFAVTQTVTPIRGPSGAALGSVLVFRDVTETRSLARRLAYQASHDTVTGLLNRREFEARLAHALEVAHNEARQHICLYMDLDQFKLVNDTCGHAAGDDLLRQLAVLMHSRLRESDALARLGGDEFGVLLEGCPLPQGTEIAEALRSAVPRSGTTASCGRTRPSRSASASASSPSPVTARASAASSAPRTSRATPPRIWAATASTSTRTPTWTWRGGTARCSGSHASLRPSARTDWSCSTRTSSRCRARPTCGTPSRSWCGCETSAAIWCRRAPSCRPPSATT